MRVLLTGSSGWLGRFLAPRLRAAAHEVVGLDVAPAAQTQVLGSVADRDLIAGLFERHRFEGVIHAGALHKPDIARESPQAFVDVNVTGTLNLLTAARAADCRRFVSTFTTSLMISEHIREERGGEAVWLERPVPQGGTPGETLSPTQPFPIAPRPLAPSVIREQDAYGLTPWGRAECRRKIAAARHEGLFTPPSTQGTVEYPFTGGGSNWGGLAFDPTRQVAYMNTLSAVHLVTLIPAAKVEAASPVAG